MHRATLPALACALLLSLTPAAAADPFTGHLDGLQAELGQRLAEDFDGPLGKAAKKQQKAVLKAQAFLAKSSDAASDDLKNLGKAAKKLSKAYASEFTPGEADQTLGLLVSGAVAAFYDEAHERRAELQFVAATLSPAKVQLKTGKVVDKVADVLSGWYEAGDTFARLKLVQKATKLLDKADKKAAKDDGEGVYLVIAAEGSTPIATDEPFAEWNALTGELQLFGQRTNTFGSVVTVAVVMEGVTGPGTYPFEGDGWSGWYEVGSAFNGTRYDIVPGSGALLVEELDLDGSVVRGTFGFDAFNAGNGVTLDFPDGAYRLTTIYQ